jgi:hypothetical protein
MTFEADTSIPDQMVINLSLKAEFYVFGFVIVHNLTPEP